MRKSVYLQLFDGHYIRCAGIDVLLVGDSASNVIAGNSTPLPIKLEEGNDKSREQN